MRTFIDKHDNENKIYNFTFHGKKLDANVKYTYSHA